MPQVTRDIRKVDVFAHLSGKAIASAVLGVISTAIFFMFPRSFDFWLKFSHNLALVLLKASIILSILTGILAVFLGTIALREIRFNRGELKGVSASYAGRTLGVIGFIFGLMMVYASPGFLEAELRSKIFQDKASLRTLAEALESYAVDQHYYPPNLKLLETVRHLRMEEGRLIQVEPYLYRVPHSVFGDRAIPRYYCENFPETTYWIAWTPGPDGDFDILLNQDLRYKIQTYWKRCSITKTNFDLTPVFCEQIYDPTNGTCSNGDIIRWRQ